MRPLVPSVFGLRWHGAFLQEHMASLIDPFR
jgi:hypothetical protein